MKLEKLLGLAGVILLVASVMPIAAAHLAQNPAGTGSPTSVGGGPLNALPGGGSETTPHPDQCREGGGAVGVNIACSSSSDVSGTYINDPRNLAVAADILPVTVNQNGAPVLTLFPAGWLGTASALCDIEVIDGTAGDETYVDGGPGGLAVPDGIWDDGGLGGACHVDYGTDFPSHYSTTGCGGDAATAQDAVSGDWVGIIASCDGGSAGGTGGGPSATGFALCSVNSVITNIGTPTSIPGDAGACVQSVLNCLNPGQCSGTTPASCNLDGVADASNFGYGGGHTGPGVAYPTNPFAACIGGGTEAAFTVTSVVANTGLGHSGTTLPPGGGPVSVDLGPNPSPTPPEPGDPTLVVSPATTGWIN